MLRRIERTPGLEHLASRQEFIRQQAERELLRSNPRQEALAAAELARTNRELWLSRAEERAHHNSVAEQYLNRVDLWREAATTTRTRDEYFAAVAGHTSAQSLPNDSYLRQRALVEEERWNSLISRGSVRDVLNSITRRASAVYEASTGAIAGRLHELDLLERRPLLSERLLAPALDYSEFSRRTLERMNTSAGENYARALDASLTLASRQISGLTAALGGVITVPEDDGEIAEPISPPALSVFDIQQEELLRVEAIPTGEDYSVIVRLSPTASIVEQATHCIMLVTHVNYTVEMRAGKPFFKPTTKSMESCALLPRITARDRDSFGAFIDCLYFIVYEGPGDAKRYLGNGLLSDEECAPVWTIKHLRSKFLRHDIDHGKDKEIKVSRGNLQWALERLGFKALPRTPEDYSRLQQAVLDDIQSFLTMVAERTEK